MLSSLGLLNFGLAPHDELAVSVVADHELVLTDQLKPVTPVESLCPKVLTEAANPQGTRPIGKQVIDRVPEHHRSAPATSSALSGIVERSPVAEISMPALAAAS